MTNKATEAPATITVQSPRAVNVGPNLAAALVKAQAELGNVAKDSTNPHFNSAFTSLAAVTDATRGTLAACGLALVQMPTTDERGLGVETMIVHSSGEALTSTMWANVKTSDPQKMGSAITYLRRYAALAVTFTAPTDDDGNGAPEPAPRKQPIDPEDVPHHASWDVARARFCAELNRLGTSYDAVKAHTLGEGWGKPSTWAQEDRRKLLDDLNTGRFPNLVHQRGD